MFQNGFEQHQIIILISIYIPYYFILCTFPRIPIPRQVRSDKVPIVDEMEDVEADLPEVDLSAEGNKSSDVSDAPPGVQENSGLRFKIRKRCKMIM